jgi:hypothetical protein
MSFALFRTEGDVGRIVAARTPDREMLGVGQRVQDQLELCPEALAFMARPCGRETLLFTLTRAGIGILSSRYRLSAGLGLYLHIHTKPASAARLINSGVLGAPDEIAFSVTEEIRGMGTRVTARDESSYPALLTAWEAVRMGRDGVFPVDGAGGLPLYRLREGIGRLADFVGCGVTFTLPKEAYGHGDPRGAMVKCYRPKALEAILLCLLSEVRERSATHGGVCRLDPYPHGREGLALTLRYPLYPHETSEEASLARGVHDYLTAVGETWGLELYVPSRPAPSREVDGLFDVNVALDWLLDPAALSSSDIKARLSLARDGGGREGEPTCVEEILWEDGF